MSDVQQGQARMAELEARFVAWATVHQDIRAAFVIRIARTGRPSRSR